MITITSASNSKIDLASLPFIELELSGSYTYDAVVYEIPAHRKMYLNWKHVLPAESNAEKIVSIQYENLDTSGFISVLVPEYLRNKWYWYGTDDCLIQYKLARDKKFLYMAAFIHDDQLVMGEGQQDLIYVDFEDKNGQATQFTIYPDPIKSKLSTDNKTEFSAENVQIVSAVEGDHTIKIMLQIPLNKISRADDSFRFNIGYRDQDNLPVPENSTLYWKPLWDTETDYQFSGTFMLEDHD